MPSSTPGDHNLLNNESCDRPALMMPRTCGGDFLIVSCFTNGVMFYQLCYSMQDFAQGEILFMTAYTDGRVPPLAETEGRGG
jgi:hypothetical protein